MFLFMIWISAIKEKHSLWILNWLKFKLWYNKLRLKIFYVEFINFINIIKILN